ncbi:MAG: AsmA-like C-terminal region-containing protein [Pseudomonadota bacterium]
MPSAKTTITLWLRRLRTLIWTALALVIISAAVLVGIGKLLMPYSERFKPRLEAVLAEQFNQPVRLQSFTGEWKAFGPRISLEGVELLGGADGEGAMAIQKAALDIKPLNALISDRPLYAFRIIGADLALLRTPDGRLELSGLGLSGRSLDAGDEAGQGDGSGLSNLARLGEVRLQDSRFSYNDHSRDLSLQLTGINGRVQMAGDRLAAQVQASLTDTRRGMVLGDLAATVKASLVDGRTLEAVEFHLETGEVMMDELAVHLPDHSLMPVSGRANAQLWGDWTPGGDVRLSGVADLRDAGLDTGTQTLHLERINALLKWRWRNKTQWRIDLANAQIEENGRAWVAPAISVERNLEGNIASWVSADFLEAEFPLEGVQLFMKELGRRWPKAAPTDGRGRVSDFDLVINGNRKLAIASGAFEDLDVLAWGPWPLPRGLNGRIDLAYGEGSLFFGGTGVDVHWARNFARPLQVDLDACELEILWDESNHWQVDALPCALTSEPLAGEARVRFVRDAGRPRVDVNARIERADLAGLRDFWPESAMSPKANAWLRRSLQAGTVESGRVVLQGDMDRFPFRDDDGTLLVEARVQGAQLDFSPGWPAAAAVDAQVTFDGPGLTVDGMIGDFAGARVEEATARIADLQSPVLLLDYASDATLPQLYGYLQASPLLDNTRLDLGRFAFSGPARTTGRLRIPLGPDRGEVTVDGTLDVRGGGFTETTSGLRLEGLTGTVGYNRDGAQAEALAVTLSGWPAELGLTAAWGTEQPFLATLAGAFPTSVLIAETPLWDDALIAQIEGEAEWDLTFTVDQPPNSDDSEVWLEARSDLRNSTMALPAPLQKPAGAAWPLRLRYPLVSAEPHLRLDIDRRLSVVLDLEAPPADTAPDGLFELPELRAVPERDAVPQGETVPESGRPLGPLPGASSVLAGAPGSGDEPAGTQAAEADAPALVVRRGAIVLGGAPAVLPPPGVLRLGGRVDSLDIDSWVSVIVDYAGKALTPVGLAFEGDDLFAESLLFLNRRFADVMLGLDFSDGLLDVQFQGAALNGDVRYQRNDDSTQSLSAQFERLWLGDAEDEGVSMETDPRSLPEMRFYVEDFRYLGLDLGETRIEAYPIAEGLHIETVDAVSEQLTFQARGDWVVTDEGSQSDFDILLTSESLGSLVNALDLSSVLEGGQTMLRYDAWWPGPPAAFELARLNGQMSFSVVDGTILNANPGAGRVLGLMSLGALPRRLALDFSDVFESGFAFDQASGTVQLDGGVAVTDDFLLESTAAQLTLTGSSNLEAKEMDYLVSIRPGVSQTLPVIGALAAGPAGAAAGLALQELLREALGDAAEARYEITGPWSDPDVSRLDSNATPGPEDRPEPSSGNATAQAQTRESL